MKLSDMLSVHIGNYNGLSHKFEGKGRLEWTLETVQDFFPSFRDLNITVFDNESQDGSIEYLRSLDFINIISRERIIAQPNWLSTTLNNMRNLGETIMSTETPYLWNIENCSFFYGNGDYKINHALDILNENHNISLVHLRRWTKSDALDRPGCGHNYCRIDELKQTRSGNYYYTLDQTDSHLIWVDVYDDFPTDFKPDGQTGFGYHPESDTEVGGIMYDSNGNIKMLVEEHWGTYTSHGWIARTNDLKHIVHLYKPFSERDMSRCFRKHYKSARLDQDAFVDFGWKTRYRDYTDHDISQQLKEVIQNDRSSVFYFGDFYREKT